MVSALKEFVAYNKELIATKRASPGDDLLSELATIPADDDRLSEDELSSMIFLLLIAGHETTVNLIGNGCHALIANPGQAAELQANPEKLPNAVEEMLRFGPPVRNSTVRVAAEPVEYGGKTIPAGSVVLLSMMSANRDPERFERPDEFDIHRTDNQHVAFGYHLHLCLGAPLARLEAKIAFGALLQRFEDFKLAVPAEELVWHPSVLMHGLEELPAVIGARRV
jgi:cytochrome P450